jgi:hypothetical protein
MCNQAGRRPGDICLWTGEPFAFRDPARSRDDLTSITGVFFDLLAGIHGCPLGRSPKGCASRQAAQGQSLRRLTA